MDEIGAATGVRNPADLNQHRQPVLFGIDHADLVRGIRGHEIASGGVHAAIVQEGRYVDAGDFAVFPGPCRSPPEPCRFPWH